jgi:predicted ATP-grasp superfamily ATP-dependent carboligase
VNSPVLILGCVTRIAVAVARSLNRRGIPVEVATFSAQEINPRSRAIRRFFRLPNPDDSARDFILSLTELIHRQRYDLIIPGNDVAFTALVENHAEISESVKIASPPPHVIERVLDKSLTIEAAQRCNVPSPLTRVVSNAAQIRDAAEELGFPFVLKPARKMRTEDFKVLTIHDASQIQQHFPANQAFASPLLAQEYCPGVGVGVEVLIHNVECVTAFQHQREKEFPYGGGVSVVARAQQPDPTLLEKSISLLRELEWDGIAMVEFRVDEQGNASLMEVNGRFWGTVSLPIACEFDFPYHQWQLLHGQSPVPSSAATFNKKWRWTAGYLRRMYGLVLAAATTPRARRQLRSEIENMSLDFGENVHDSLWSSSDPLPAILEFFDALKDILVSAGRSLFRTLFQSRHRVETKVRQARTVKSTS